jgi:hypothetical protein
MGNMKARTEPRHLAKVLQSMWSRWSSAGRFCATAPLAPPLYKGRGGVAVEQRHHSRAHSVSPAAPRSAAPQWACRHGARLQRSQP